MVKIDKNRKEYSKKYYLDNREKLLNYRKEYVKNNKNKIIEYSKKYYLKHEDKYKTYHRLYHQSNIEIIHARKKQYRKDNREKLSVKEKEYYQNNKDSILLYHKEYRKVNQDKANRYYRNKRKTDVNYKLASNLGCRLRCAIRKNQKAGSFVRDLGCSIPELKAYLESQFAEGMTWENWGRCHGKWNIDHILPLSSFDLTNREEFLKACHYTNLQPLWYEDNMKKGCKKD